MSDRTGPYPKIRHIPWTSATSECFGDHYITRDPSLPTAEQFDIHIYPRGDTMRLGGDPLRTMPHVRITVWDGQAWQDAGIVPIGRPEPCNCEHTSHFDDTPAGSPAPHTDHEYLKVPAGNRTARYVGRICDHCADTHMAGYLTESSR